MGARNRAGIAVYDCRTAHQAAYAGGIDSLESVLGLLKSIKIRALYGREPGGCECGVGWSGEGCSICAPYPGCANGGCTQPWECTCQVKNTTLVTLKKRKKLLIFVIPANYKWSIIFIDKVD